MNTPPNDSIFGNVSWGIDGLKTQQPGAFNPSAGYHNDFGEGDDRMGYYGQLGMAMLQQQQMAAQQAQQQMVAPPAAGMDLSNQGLTRGFNPNWLASQTTAGSANGQKIG
jgi:hypothetical protein